MLLGDGKNRREARTGHAVRDDHELGAVLAQSLHAAHAREAGVLEADESAHAFAERMLERRRRGEIVPELDDFERLAARTHGVVPFAKSVFEHCATRRRRVSGASTHRGLRRRLSKFCTSGDAVRQIPWKCLQIRWLADCEGSVRPPAGTGLLQNRRGRTISVSRFRRASDEIERGYCCCCCCCCCGPESWSVASASRDIPGVEGMTPATCGGTCRSRFSILRAPLVFTFMRGSVFELRFRRC